MKNKFKVGMRVEARCYITEGGGNTKPDYNAKFLSPEYVHAVVGDMGTVEYVDDDGYPTVRFDRTGTATVVWEGEVRII